MRDSGGGLLKDSISQEREVKNLSKVKVSVILPSYNVADYIKQCVKSVASQTLKEIEILCIDAGSEDGTLEILESEAKKDSRIRVVYSEVKSYGYQMNLGIREAKGEYIGIVETDDFVDSDMFEILYERAIKDNCDMVKGILYEVFPYEGNREKEFLCDYIPAEIVSGVTFSPDERPQVHDWDGNIWNGIYRRDFLLGNNLGFQETPGAAFQDIYFQQKVLNAAQKVTYLRAHFYHYRKVRPGASTWNPKCVEYIYKAYYDLLGDSGLKEGHKKYIYTRMAQAFLYELNKALYLFDYDIASPVLREAVEWYDEKIHSSLRDDVFSFDEINDSNLKDTLLFFADRDMYIRKIKNRMESLYVFLEEIKERNTDNSVVIFGFGRYGHMLLSFLLRNGVWVDSFADNKPGVDNTSFHGIRVNYAIDAVRINKNALFIIANKKSGKEISLQLQEYGVDEKKIMMFDGSNKYLLEGVERGTILAR